LLPYPHIDPVIVRIGPLALRWYGFMYLLGFAVGFFAIRARLKRTAPAVRSDQVEGLIFCVMVGLLVGARLGELLFYHWMEWGYYLSNPIEIIAVWHGGMSFHGGLIGSVLMAAWYMRRQKMPFLLVADAVCLAAPAGLLFGRLGNFINGELFGRVTDLPWAMVFPHGGPFPRHPSQLYEAFLEGPLLWLILWLVRDRVRPGAIIALFVMGYSIFRFLVEFVREPDPQIGLLLGPLTMGQMLCLAQAAAGLILWHFLPKGEKAS
jgi:phosphatidylglycerol:prolipoprotein diacylglycerol transferase